MGFWYCKTDPLNQTSINILKIIIYNQEVAISGLTIDILKSYEG